MNFGLFTTGFALGTFKFLFAHWAAYGAAAGMDYTPHFYEIFVAVTAGAWFSMSIFYFSSGYFMRRAHEKKINKINAALLAGQEPIIKKKFTKTNKTIVWIKHRLGFYGITILAPLFLSIPIGSIICAKFYGHKKKTFYFMILFTGTYSFLMSLWIHLST